MNHHFDTFVEALPDVTPGTRKAYLSDLRQFAKWYRRRRGEPLQTDLLWKDLEAEYEADITGRGFSPATVRRRVCTLRRFIEWSVEQGLIEPSYAGLSAESCLEPCEETSPAQRTVRRARVGPLAVWDRLAEPNEALDRWLRVLLVVALGLIAGFSFFAFGLSGRSMQAADLLSLARPSQPGAPAALLASTPVAGAPTAVSADPAVAALPTPAVLPSPTPAGAEEEASPAPPAPTDPPETAASQPSDPGFNPAHPFRFCGDGNCVDFANAAQEMTISLPFAGASVAVTPVFPVTGQHWEDYFPLCGSNILITNAKDGDSEDEVWYKTIIYAHSGRCRGRWLTGEYLRNYLEGGYFVPSAEQRSRRLEDIKGQQFILDQGDGPVTFEVVDAVYLEEDSVTEYAADPGSLDRFFPTGVQEGKHEIFLIFCGSIGPLQSGNPMDFFTSRYVLRLQVVEEGGTTS